MKIKFLILYLVIVIVKTAGGQNPPPPVPSGATCILPADNHFIIYSITPVNGAIGYTWTAPVSSYITKTQTTDGDSVTIEWKSLPYQAIIQLVVTAQFPTGSPTTNQTSISLNIQIGTTGSVTGDNSVCPGDQAVSYSAIISNASSYNWYQLPLGMAYIGSPYASTVNINFAQNVSPGNYTVSVTGTNGICVSQPRTFNITVNPLPVANFTDDGGINHCAGDNVHFTNTSSPTTGLSYLWNFNDPPSGNSNNTSVLKNPIHEFWAFGSGTQIFMVSLVVTTVQGCKDTATHFVTVKKGPEIKLNSPFNYCSVADNHEFAITNKTTLPTNNLNYTIDWNDTTADFTSTGNDWPYNATVNHTYYGLGNHYFTISVTDGTCSNDSNYNAFIGSTPSLNCGTNGNTVTWVGESLSFNNTVTQNPNPDAVFEFWVDDGSPHSTWQGMYPPAYTHTFNITSVINTSNYFTYHVSSTTPCGTMNCNVFPIIVWQKSQSDFGITNSGGPNNPNGCCYWGGDGITSYVACNPVSFQDMTASGYYIYSPNNDGNYTYTQNTFYYWDFGDPASGSNNNSTIQNPVHNFTTAGWFDVQLVTCTGLDNINENSGFDTVSYSIYIQTPPIPDFSVSSLQDCVPFELTFNNLTDTSDFGYYRFQWEISPGTGWNFSNSYNANSFEPKVTFSEPGYYIITLNAQNSCGIITYDTTFIISGPPEVNFNDTIISLCSPQSFSMDSSVIQYNDGFGTVVNQPTWTLSGMANFTGGTNSHSIYPVINFPVATTYYVSVSYSNECDTFENTITVNVIPYISGNSICCNQIIASGSTSSTISGSTPSGGNAAYGYQWQESTVGAVSGFTNVSGANGMNYSSPVLYADTWYRRIVISGACRDTSASVKITVQGDISPGTIEADQTICYSTVPVPLTGSAASGGSGLFVYQWEVSTTGTGSGFLPVSGATSTGYAPGIITQTSWFRRKVSNQTPPTQETYSNVIVINVNQNIGNNNLTTPDSVCAGDNLPTITGSLPAGGNGAYNYQWQINASGCFGTGFSDIPGATGIDHTPSGITQTSWFRRKVISPPCSESTSNCVQLIIYSLPVSYCVTGGGSYPCGGSGLLVGLNGSESGVQYTLYRDGSNTGISNIGGGTAFNFPLQTLAGTYTVMAFNPVTGCGALMDCNVQIICNPLPEVYQITGGGNYCEGGPGVNICLSSSEVNVSYELLLNEVTTGIQLPGINGQICFNNITAGGVYSIRATNITTLVSQIMEGSVSVTVNPLPLSFLVFPAEDCNGSEIYINGSQSGVGYELLFEGSSFSPPVIMDGTGQPWQILNFGNQNAIGEYTVIATDTLTYCSATLEGSSVLNPFPNVFDLNPPGVQCIGAELFLSGSEAGVTYHLIRTYQGISAIITTITGNGSAVSFGNQYLEGTYTAEAVNQYNCAANMNNEVHLNELPDPYTVTSSGNCAPVLIGLNNSDNGIIYELYRDNSFLEAVHTGTGGAFTFDSYYLSGTYSVTAYNPVTMCETEMLNDITVSQLPYAYNIQPNGPQCLQTGDSIEINLPLSDSGVNYQLYLNNSVLGNTVPGNSAGSSISFGMHNSAGVYTILATNPGTGCTSWMNGNVQIIYNPYVYTITTTGNCTGSVIGVSGSQNGITYNLLLNGGQPAVLTYTGTGNSFSFGPQFIEGLYTVIAIDTNYLCQTSMIGSVEIQPDPLAFGMSPHGILCDNDTAANIYLDDSEAGINYQLILNSSIVITTVTGDGNPINFGNPGYEGSYSVIAINPVTGCYSNMLFSTILTPAPEVYSVMNSGTACTGASVKLSWSQTGVLYRLWRDTTILIQSLPGINGILDFGPQNMEGYYTITAENISSGCQADMYGSMTIFPDPVQFDLYEQGVNCGDADIYLSGSQTGVSYQLFCCGSSNPLGPSQPGTGSTVIFGNYTSPGNVASGTYYWVMATYGTYPYCQSVMNYYLEIFQNPLQFNIQPQGTVCVGTEITLANSEIGTSYKLKRYGFYYPSGSNPLIVTGNGGPLSFGTGLPFGIYTIEAVNNSTLCSSIMNGSVTVNSVPVVYNLSAPLHYCANTNGVTITLDHSELNVAYQLFKNDTAEGMPLYGAAAGNSLMWTNMTEGVYFVIASLPIPPDSSCSSTMNGILTVEEVEVPFISAFTIQDNITCQPGCGGSVEIVVTGGNSGCYVDYQYLWSDGSNSQNITGVCSGNYSVTATDCNGCQATGSYAVSDVAPITVQTIIGNCTCPGGNDGYIITSVTGGTGPYTFVWSNGNVTQNIGDLQSGYYYITITDADHCTYYGSFYVGAPQQINVTGAVTNPSCFLPGNDGAIDITVTGGTAPYNFQWSTGSTTEDIQNLVTGFYYLNIVDFNGCVYINAYSDTLTSPIDLLVNHVETPPSCCGANNGKITLNVSGGVPPYHYAWSGPSSGSGMGGALYIINGLTGGLYIVTVTDFVGCPNPPVIQQIFVDQPGCMAIDYNVSITNCAYNINLAVTGGTSGYSFHWNNNQTTDSISGLAPGTYCVTIIDQNSCDTVICIPLEMIPPVQFVGSSHGCTCNQADFGIHNNGFVQLNVTSGIFPFSFICDKDFTPYMIGTTFSNIIDINGLSPGIYCVTVTDMNGCSSSAFYPYPSNCYVITEPEPMDISGFVINTHCNSADSGYIGGLINVTNVVGETPPYTYTWDQANCTTCNPIDNLPAGNYTVSVTDILGCYQTAVFTVTSPPPLNISGTVTNCTCNSADNPAYLTNNGSISLVITGETPLYTFLWSNGSTDKNQFSLSPENYTVTVTDSQGCSNTYHHWITEHDPFDLSCNITPIQPCYNIDNGIVCMIVHGEVPPYTYSWSVAGNTDACITGLGSGNYVVTVTDDNGCWNINSCIVDEPGPVQVNAAIQNNFCNSLDGPPSGSIMLTVVGGVSPYTFTCTDSYGTDWPYPFVNLPSGYYCITINECDTTICYPVNEPLPLSVSLNSYNDENCFYSCDGNINITITGGTPPYFNNNWTCSGTCFCPFPPNAESLVGIGGGTYTLDVHDANFCPYPGFTPVTLSQTINHPPELTVFSTHTDCTGPGCCDGSINLNISGGITPYSINWTYLEDSSFFSTSANNTCLCPGTYQYEVGFTGLDGNPCIMTDIIVINTPTDSIYLDCGFAYCASDLETNIITVHLPAFMMGETVNLIIEGYDITPPGGPILSYTVSDYIVPNPPVYTFSPGTPPWVPFVLNTLQYNVSVTFTAAIPACDDCILENFCELEVYPVPAVTLNDPEIKICCDSLPVFTGVPATIIGAPGTQYVIIYTVTSLADTVTVPFTGTINPPNYSEIIHLPLPPVVNCNAAICPADIWSFTINSISIMFDTIVTCQGSTIIDSCAVYLIPDPVANIDNLSVLPPSPVPGIACEDDTVKIQITFQGVPPFYLLYNDGYNTGPYYSCFDMPGGPAGCNQLTQTGPCVYTGNIYYVPPVIPYPYNFIFSLAEMWDSNMPEANCSGHVSGIQSLIVYPVPDAQFEDAAMSICGFPSTICISVELTGSPPFYITPDIEYPPGTIIPQPVVGPVYQNSYELCIPSPLPVATADCFNVILSNVSDGSPALCNADSTDNITVCLVDQPAIAPGDITVNPVCEDQDTTSVCVNFSGNGPWTIIYTQNSVVYSVTLNCTTMPCCFFVNPSFGQIIITGLKIDDCQDTVLLNIPLIFNTIPLRTASLSIAAGSVNTICKGEAVMLTLNLTGVPDWDVTIEDGLGNPVIYLNDISSSPFSFLVTPTSTTEYYITSVSNDDVIQCPFIISNDALVVVNNNPDAFFCCSDISICPCVSSSVCISFTGTPPFNLLLSDGVNQVSEIFNVHTVDYDLNKIPPYCVAPFPVTTVYNLLMVTDGTGCSTKLSGFTNITVDDGLPECPCYLEIPTSFSPNGDNINDRLSAEYSDNFIYFDFRVFNIWGDCVFRTNDVSFSWDGRRDGTNEILDMQVFYYYIDAICSSNERVFKKGNITLIK